MPAKQGSSPKLKRAGKNKRVVANPIPVNRTGGRKPAPRQITNADKVKAIRTKLLQELTWFLESRDVEIPAESHRARYIDCLIGIDEDDCALELLRNSVESVYPEVLAQIHRAFVFAYQAVPDAAFITLPGTKQEFFSALMAAAEREKKEAQERARNRRNSRTRVGQTANVANRIAAASGLR